MGVDCTIASGAQVDRSREVTMAGGGVCAFGFRAAATTLGSMVLLLALALVAVIAFGSFLASCSFISSSQGCGQSAGIARFASCLIWVVLLVHIPACVRWLA